MTELLTTDEAAALLLVAPKTLKNWRSLGSGPAYIKRGRRVAYRVTDLNDWLDANRTAARTA